jgi:hypothetical protein
MTIGDTNLETSVNNIYWPMHFDLVVIAQENFIVLAEQNNEFGNCKTTF